LDFAGEVFAKPAARTRSIAMSSAAPMKGTFAQETALSSIFNGHAWAAQAAPAPT